LSLRFRYEEVEEGEDKQILPSLSAIKVSNLTDYVYSPD
jgi:hypothetical protein